MKRVAPAPEFAVPLAVQRLLEEFQYPDDLGGGGPVTPAVGGGGMAHVLIVSDSEPQQIQDKADFVIPQTSSSGRLQLAFDEISAQNGGEGAWSIWMAGVFDLDADVVAPNHAWIRGLGYTASGCVV